MSGVLPRTPAPDGEAPSRRAIALAIVMDRDRHVLIGRRPAGSHLAGSWEFPGGKVEAGEEPGHAAVRELREETGLIGTEPLHLITVEHDEPGRCLALHVFRVRVRPVPAPAVDVGRFIWVGLDDLPGRTMPPANREIVRFLLDGMDARHG
ncbi:MAG: (deoxy)nucleoside triphosphate pyrophosphohydrolase [Acidobacteriota bacterium]